MRIAPHLAIKPLNRLYDATRERALQVRAFLRDRKGVAAVEFAIVVPLLLSMYFVTLEVGQGIETNKKVGRIASMVGDLVAQEPVVTKADLEAIMKIGASIIQPYYRSNPKIVITGIQMDGASPPVMAVKWRRQIDENGVASGSVASGEKTTVPSTLRIANSFLVRVEATLTYKPVIAWTAEQSKATGIIAPFNNLPMGETYYLRSRMSAAVQCADC